MQMAGIQSTNAIWTGTTSYGASGGGLAWDERVAASNRMKYESANCGDFGPMVMWKYDQTLRSHRCGDGMALSKE